MDPNARDSFGMTALHKACLVGDWPGATSLMKAGGDPLLVDDEGRNAMFFSRCIIKGFTYAASEAFATAGVSLAASNPLRGMSDREAHDLGVELFQRGLAAENAGARGDPVNHAPS